jgi:hypothetical protein
MPQRDPRADHRPVVAAYAAELLRAFTTATSADEPWDGSEDRDLTPDDEAKVSAWVDRRGKRSGKRSALRKKGRYRPPERRAMPAPRLPPPVESVGALWAAARPVTDDADLVRQLHGRCLDPTIIEERDLARCLPHTGALPRWARCRSQTWRESGHRLLLPMWNVEGSLCSVHARLIESRAGDIAKGLFPTGHSTKGLFLADSFALSIIQKGTPEWWRRSDPPSIIITEGAPDFLTVATHYGTTDDAPGVLGVLSGSWSDGLAARIPNGYRVVVKTHRDEAGTKYRDMICRSLRGRCRVLIEASEPSDG